jgi:hypothetical protein
MLLVKGKNILLLTGAVFHSNILSLRWCSGKKSSTIQSQSRLFSASMYSPPHIGASTSLRRTIKSNAGARYCQKNQIKLQLFFK